MKSQPVVLVDGQPQPAGPLDVSPVVTVNTTLDFLSYNAEDNLRRPGHRHFILAPWLNAYLGPDGPLSAMLTDERISGVVFTTSWETLEPQRGVYKLGVIVNAVQRCRALGKRLILRIFAKNYYLGASPALPGYIRAMIGATYPVYLNGCAVGIGAMFENDLVRDRWSKLISRLASRFASIGTVIGIVAPDESARSAWNGFDLPTGMVSGSVMSVNEAMWQQQAALFGARRTMPCVNFVDGYESQAGANANARALQTAMIASGMSIAVSDTFALPEAMSQYLQPVYFQMPPPGMTSTGNVLVHVDDLSLGAIDDTLDARMQANAIQTYRLGATITAWSAQADYWPAMQRAIDATLAFRTAS